MSQKMFQPKRIKNKIVQKIWGREEWIVNSKKYNFAGKLLFLRKNHRSSLHYHNNKTELFYIDSGKVLLEVGGEQIILNRKESFLVKQGIPHRFTGLQTSRVIEFSTSFDEKDSHRITKSEQVKRTKNNDVTMQSYNQIVSRYYRDTLRKQPGRELKEFTSSLERIFKNTSTIRVIDLGCGPGRDLRSFINKGFSATGVDFSPNMLAHAKQIAPEARLLCERIEEVRLPSNYFHGVWATASLQHVKKEDMANVLKKVYKTIIRHGLFFLDLRIGYGEALEKTNEYGKKIKRFFAYYSEEEIAQYLDTSGFDILYRKVFVERRHGRNIRKIRILSQRP